jgi:hypothetical protein
MLRPEEFGAVADGERDDTAALQAALNRAQGSGVRLQPRPYAIRETLLVPTSCVLEGRGAVIIQKSDNRPILASLAWTGRGPTKGYTRILGLRLQGTGRGERQDGIVLHDYWSEIVDVEVVDPGGRGIVLAEDDQRGSRPTSTLVENRVRNCVVRNARRAAFLLGKPENGKLTDGELTNCIASLHDSAREPAVAIGHSAGWIVNGLHTYGGHPRTALEIHNPFFTSLSNLYMEGFDEAGLSINGVQTSVSVSNLHIIAKRFGQDAAFIRLSGHRTFETSTALLSNIGLWNDGPNPVTAVRLEGKPVRLTANGVALSGPGGAKIAPGALQGPGTPAPAETGKHIAGWIGRAPQRVVIASRPGGERFESAFAIAITGRSPDGGLTTAYSGVLHWSRMNAGDPATIADLVETSPVRGFQKAPEIMLEKSGDGVTLALAFTPIASGPGRISIR